MRLGRFKTLLGFFLLPLISMAASFIAIPVLVRTGGSSGWTAVAVGQGIGATAALVVAFGWGTVGPAQVARIGDREQRHLYWLSVIMRSGLWVLAVPAAAIVTSLLVDPRYVATGVLMSATVTAQSLSPGWFLIGQGRPLAIAAMETGPRAVAQLTSVLAVLVTQDLIWYGAVLLAGELAISCTAFVKLARRDPGQGSLKGQLQASFREQWPLAASALVGAGYTRAAVPIVSVVAYPAAAVFAALDRVQTLTRNGLRPIISYFQGWVARPGSRRKYGRAPMASAITISVGTVVAMLVATLLPVLDVVLFGNVLAISGAQAALLGVVIVCISVSYSTGLYYLVPRGALRVLSISSIVGSVAGVPLLLLLSSVAGATGAMAAIACAEGLVVLWQVIYLVITRRAPGPIGID